MNSISDSCTQQRHPLGELFPNTPELIATLASVTG